MSLSGLLYVENEFAGTDWAFLDPILSVLHNVIWPILVVVAAVGTIYAIYLGVVMAKAENAEKREEAKKRIINAVIAVVVMVVLILLLQLFTNNAKQILGITTSAIGLLK
ncbi:MAG: Mbov_0395 family pilin-like conjugal transfer protein [Christensenellales bacterium]